MLQFAMWCACAELGQTLLISGPCLSWLSCQRLLALSCFEAACYRNIDKPWIRKSHSRLLLKSYYHRIRCYSIPHTIRRYSPSHRYPIPSHSGSHNNQTTSTNMRCPLGTAQTSLFQPICTTSPFSPHSTELIKYVKICYNLQNRFVWICKLWVHDELQWIRTFRQICQNRVNWYSGE